MANRRSTETHKGADSLEWALGKVRECGGRAVVHDTYGDCIDVYDEDGLRVRAAGDSEHCLDDIANATYTPPPELVYLHEALSHGATRLNLYIDGVPWHVVVVDGKLTYDATGGPVPASVEYIAKQYWEVVE